MKIPDNREAWNYVRFDLITYCLQNISSPSPFFRRSTVYFKTDISQVILGV